MKTITKTALITGASSGIGKELAFVFARNNYDLVLVARRKERLEEIKETIKKEQSISIEIIEMDLANLDSAEKLYDEVAGRNINVLINNAGFGIYGDMNNIDIESEEKMLILNIITLTKLTRLFAKNMMSNQQGNIVNIASTAAFQAVPGMASYAASKAYVLNFSEAIAYELEKFNIKVTTICPGATQTEFADVANINSKLFNSAPTAKELAEFTFREMHKGKITSIHGVKNSIMTFASRFSPRKINTSIAARVMK